MSKSKNAPRQSQKYPPIDFYEINRDLVENPVYTPTGDHEERLEGFLSDHEVPAPSIAELAQISAMILAHSGNQDPKSASAAAMEIWKESAKQIVRHKANAFEHGVIEHEYHGELQWFRKQVPPFPEGKKTISFSKFLELAIPGSKTVITTKRFRDWLTFKVRHRAWENSQWKPLHTKNDLTESVWIREDQEGFCRFEDFPPPPDLDEQVAAEMKRYRKEGVNHFHYDWVTEEFWKWWPKEEYRQNADKATTAALSKADKEAAERAAEEAKQKATSEKSFPEKNAPKPKKSFDGKNAFQNGSEQINPGSEQPFCGSKQSIPGSGQRKRRNRQTFSGS